MKKKDEKLSNIFNSYTEGMEPPKKLTDSATSFLRAQNSINVHKKDAAHRRRLKRALGLGALGLAIVLLLTFLISTLTGYFNNLPKYYSAKSLECTTVSAAEIAEIEKNLDLEKELFPILGETDAKYILYYFSDTKKTAFIVCKTRYELNGNIVDIKITAELTVMYFDVYRHFFDYTTSETQNTKIYSKENYENGEYVTEAAFKNQNIKYYLEAMSPVYVNIIDYYNLFG